MSQVAISENFPFPEVSGLKGDFSCQVGLPHDGVECLDVGNHLPFLLGGSSCFLTSLWSL